MASLVITKIGLENIMSKCINVKYEGKPLYNIVIEQSFDKLAEEFDKLGVTGRKLCIVSDSNVAPLYAKHIEEQLLRLAIRYLHLYLKLARLTRILIQLKMYMSFLLRTILIEKICL